MGLLRKPKRVGQDIAVPPEAEGLSRIESLVLQGINDAVITIDSQGVIRDLNPAAERVIGWSREESVGQNHVDLYKAAKVSRIATNELAESLEENGYWQGEYSFVRPDGSKAHVEATTYAVNDPESGKMGRVFVVRDMTESKQVDEALRESQKRLEEACRIARLGHWEFDVAARRFTAYSKVFFDREETEYSFEDALRPIHPEDIGRVRAAFERSFTEGVLYDETNRVVYDDGRIGHMRLVAKAVRDDVGAVVGLRGTTQDISEQVIAIEATRRSEASLENAQRIARIGSWELELIGNDLTWSDEIYRMFEVDPECFGASYEAFLDVIHPDDRAEVDKAYRGSLVERTPYEITHRLRMPDGRIKWVQERCETEFAADGTPLLSRGTVQDVTERKQLEDQLRQAQKMEVVGQLTGGVAHDFNNLLMVISGNLELALERLPANSDIKPVLTQVIQAGERGADLTGQLLAFSRRQSLSPQPTDINKLTGRVLQLAGRTLGEQVRIVFEPQADLYQANIDAAQLESALLNIAINARDAMPDSGTLTIRTRAFTSPDKSAGTSDMLDAGDYVVVEVEDTGTGMSEDVREKAFEPFFTTKEAGKGSGLGLSMVYGFVKQSGGHIDIESGPGEGTTIRLYLPRSERAAEAGREAQTRTQEVQGSGETVLIVEDDPDVRKLAVSLVEKLGYTVIKTSEAESALEIVSNGTQVDLVLSDVILGGGMNGMELAKRVREKHPNTQVLLMSGYAPEAFKQDGGVGATHELIGKPFKMADLARKIDALLHQQASGPAAP